MRKINPADKKVPQKVCENIVTNPTNHMLDGWKRGESKGGPQDLWATRLTCFVSTLRSHLPLWVILGFARGGWVIIKWMKASWKREALPLPGTAAAHTWHGLSRQKLVVLRGRTQHSSSLNTENKWPWDSDLCGDCPGFQLLLHFPQAAVLWTGNDHLQEIYIFPFLIV